MGIAMLSAIEALLLIAGVLGASRFTRWIVRGGQTGWLSSATDGLKLSVVLMASTVSWLILVGMIPFFVFALFAEGASSPVGKVGAVETLVLNVIPFALVAAPLIGFGLGMRRHNKSRPG